MSSTTADIRDYLAKQMRELAGLSDLDPADEKDRAKLTAAVEVAKASAGVAAQFTKVVKVPPSVSLKIVPLLFTPPSLVMP